MDRAALQPAAVDADAARRTLRRDRGTTTARPRHRGLFRQHLTHRLPNEIRQSRAPVAMAAAPGWLIYLREARRIHDDHYSVAGQYERNDHLCITRPARDRRHLPKAPTQSSA